MGGWRSEEGVGVLRVVRAETPDSLRGENRHLVVDIGSTLLELTASCLEPVFRKAPIPSDQGEKRQLRMSHSWVGWVPVTRSELKCSLPA